MGNVSMSDKPKHSDTQPIAPVKQTSSLVRLIRNLLLILVVVIAIVFAAGFEPITELAGETIALLTNSRLPESSTRLQFSLTTPRNLTYAFEDTSKGLELEWSGSEWRPSRPPGSEYRYEVSVFTLDGARITSFLSEKPALSVNDIGGYLGQTLRFTVQAIGTIRIGEHEYEFKSEAAEFSWIVPAATATPTTTATNTPTSTPTNTPTSTPTSSPTATSTRLPKNSAHLSYLISTPDNLSFDYNVRTDGGTIRWGRSNWVPSKPSGASNIAYEVRLTYANRTFGPYAVTGIKRTFSNLDTEPSQRLRFTVIASGTIRIGEYEYDFTSQPVEFAWIRPTATPSRTPTNTPTDTSTPTPTDTFTPTNTFTPTKTSTPTYTPTASNTPTNTNTPTATFTPSDTPTATDTPTNTPTATATDTATNTSTPTETHTPTPTRLPSSHPRLDFMLSTPDNLQSAFTSLGGLRVEWTGAKWSPGKPDDQNTLSYEVTVINPNGTKGETRTTRGTSIDFRSAARYKSRQVRFRVEAVGTIRIDGHEYEIRASAVEGAPLYVPSYDYVLETGTSWDDNLPGYCDIRLVLKRGREYDIEVVYQGDTYEWYRVDLYDSEGKKLDISSTRRVGSGSSREYHQRYEGTVTLKPGVYTALARELNPSRRKTFAFVLDAQGDYSVQVGGVWC